MKIICIGEALVDFVPYGKEGTYIRSFGGAPANVAVTAARLGCGTQFIGTVGNDQFGKYILKVLKNENVDTSCVGITDEAYTTLSFVHLSENGERSFEFVRKPGADMLLSEADISDNFCEKGDIVHFGSAQLMSGAGRAAMKKAVEIAKKSSAAVSFDPNYRPVQWTCGQEAREIILEYITMTDILKVSDEEALWLTGEDHREAAAGKLQRRNKGIVIMTCGAGGAFYEAGNFNGWIKGFKVSAVDTTGAGDTFWGTFLAGISATSDILHPDRKATEEAMKLANAAGALCVRHKGSITHSLSMAELRQMTGEIAKAVTAQPDC